MSREVVISYLISFWMLGTGVVYLVFAWRVLRFFSALSDLSSIKPQAIDWPKISLVVPACNEAHTIGSAVQSLLQIDYPNIEFILVDDRSTDATLAILESAAARDPRVKVLVISELPAGWLGKVHALHSGERLATGEWILFTDADVHYGRDCLRRAMTYCLENQVDYLCVSPELRTSSLALKAIIAQFFHNATIAVDLPNLNDMNPRNIVGGGVFALMNRAVYRRSKGLDWLRLEVIDDLGLARTMKEAGAKLGFLVGLGELDLEWYPGFVAFVRGLEKNAFGAFQYSLPIVLSYVAVSLVSFGGAFVAPFTTGFGWPTVFVYSCLILYLGVTGLLLPRAIRTSPWIAVLFPLTSVVMPLIMLRACLICLKNGGVSWRGTFYPLWELKRHQRLKLFSKD